MLHFRSMNWVLKNLAILLLSSMALWSCSGDDELSSADQLKLDMDKIEKYIADNNLTATKTASGLHYVQIKAGVDSLHPNINSTVEVLYKGYFLDGDVFDQTRNNKSIEFRLSQVILGWQEGIQLMSAGEKGTLLLPSALAYGPRGNSGIPPNSVLAFDVELLSFR
jgi:FKBP-type peptidyl-prolyl cis-trans isomerase FkpA